MKITTESLESSSCKEGTQDPNDVSGNYELSGNMISVRISAKIEISDSPRIWARARGAARPPVQIGWSVGCSRHHVSCCLWMIVWM